MSESRWQPTRCGLLNLFRYDDEVFHFAGGRLLLRGNNGCGKTRVLALTLPFLFDGEVRPARVEPDGDSSRRFEWHLLMDRYHERTGYTWLEFERVDALGGPHWVTIGCGLRALQGHQGLRQRWFFVTSQRVGSDFPLKSADGVPWNRDDCKQALSGQGALFDRAEDYRRAVDEALFGLGEQRYRSLIDLLIELRRPQLSRTLDEGRLTRALAEALPPIAAGVINEVAEGFEGLEDERLRLHDTQEALRAVEAFIAEYQTYLAVRVRRLADRLRREHARYDEAQGDLRTAERRIAAATQELARIHTRREALDAEYARAAGEEEALRASEAMKSVEQLARLREDCARWEAQVADDRHTSEQHAADHERQEERLEKLAQQVAAASARATQHARLLSSEATALGSDALLARYLADEASADLLRNDAEERLRAADELLRLDSHRRDAAQREALRGEAEQAAENARDTALATAEDADDAQEQALSALRQAWMAQAAELRELRLDAEAVEELLTHWFADIDQDDPLASVLQDQAQELRRDLAREDGRLQLAANSLQQSVEALEAEAVQLRAGQDPAPTRPVWRDPSLREASQGAALWACCDFHDHLDETERAGLEAALEASQLLDAWIDSTGSLHSPSGECLLRADAPVATPNANSLLHATPGADTALTAGQIERVLAAIAIDDTEAPAWVSCDGRWGLGPLRGAWTKAQATHIGAGSRQAARAARLRAIASELSALDQERAACAEARAHLAARLARIDAESASVPDPAACRRAGRHLRAANEALAQRQDELATAQRRRQESRTALAEATQERDARAADCGFSAWLDRLADLRQALHRYQRALDQLLLLHERLQERHVAQEEAAAELTRINERLQHQRARLAASTSDWQRRQREWTVLEETRGEAVADLLARLERLHIQQATIAEEHSQLQAERDAARDERAAASEAERRATHELERFTVDRQEAIAALRAVSARGLLSSLGDAWRAGPGADATDTQILQLARDLAKALHAVQANEEELSRVGTRIGLANQELQTALSQHDHRVRIEEHQGIWDVRILIAGRSFDSTGAALFLSDQLDHLRQALSAEERRVIENFLIDEACVQLHDLLHAAEAWIADVNRELAERPMSTGLSLRFRRLVAEDAPAACDEACERLLRPQHAWSPADREALARFLQQGIDTAREALPGHSWQEQLARALDYRRWHQIAIERQQEGRWLRLTRRSHGTGSGGEKAIALTVPQFAAAAAHYRACPEAPRLIMLDEAFVGIDADMRRKCMGLLCAFNLDVVMTSEREWGCYDTVPALAIYQLATRPGSDCVACTHYIWNGHERQRQAADH